MTSELTNCSLVQLRPILTYSGTRCHFEFSPGSTFPVAQECLEHHRLALQVPELILADHACA